MFSLYFKIAFRYLQKNKLYSFINILGLVIGVASFILIMGYVDYERSYDKFEGSENVYRPYLDYLEGDTFVPGDAMTYNVTGPTFKREFPEVVEQIRLYPLDKVSFVQKNKILQETNGLMADASYFQIFNYPLIKGNKLTVLEEPNSLVLTESLAKKLYGNSNPMGKILSVFWAGSEVIVTVKGVMKDVPKNTHLKTNFLISFSTIKSWDAFLGQQEPSWSQNNFFTFIKVEENTDIYLLRQKIMKSNFEGNNNERHNIEPLEDIHLYSDKPYEAEANGSVTRVKFLSAIAFIILILSWLNYINLSTTKSLERAKEIGIRKVAGAQRSQLILQSLLESIILNSIAIGIAMLLTIILLPAYNSFTGKTLSLQLSDINAFLPVLSFILFGMLLTGLYPALLLSSYSPSRALKGKIRASANGLNTRKGLIIAQFLATIILLVGTIVVTKQINFLQEQPLGVNLQQVIALKGEMFSKKTDSLLAKDAITLGEELKKLPFINAISTAQTYPGDGYENLSSTVGITYPDGTTDDKTLYYTYPVHSDYFELLDIEFVAGEKFRPTATGLSNKIVINEKFIRDMGISKMEDAIDKTVKFWGQEWVISGVIKNYHHFGLKNTIKPMVIRQGDAYNNLLIKLNPNTASTSGFAKAIAEIKAKWIQIFPQSTFNYTFLDKKFQVQYNEDTKFSTVFRIFTILAILIASMGLFGLTSYTCIQRKKEIGIRKVNGATISQVLSLLNKDFVKWVGIAFVIAVPISWYAMNKWLEGFAYKTTISWWIFVLAGITALSIALLTVSWQSFRAATNNPVDVLRDE
jgi:putative ABC transport system permease protein